MNRRQAIGGLAGISALSSFASHSTLGSTASHAENHSVDSKKPLRRGYLNSAHGQLHYWEAGSGPTLVLIHQSSNSSEEFISLVPLLAEHYRLIAMDLPGHGQSSDPAIEPTVDDYSTAIAQVLDHLEINRTHILGHHGGALAAMNLIAQQPSRFDKAILSGTGGIPSAKKRQDFIDLLTRNQITVSQDAQFMARAWRQYMEQMSDGAEPLDMVKPFMAYLDARLRPHRSVIVNLKWDRSAVVRQLKGPVLLVQGERDEYVSGQESLLDIIPNSTRVSLPGCGTFMFYDKPQVCADMIRKYLG